MINLTGVCLIRHHIKAWEQVQATIIDLDKYCDRILIFSFNQSFKSQLEDLNHSKITIKYLPISASTESIQKYIINCFQFVSTKSVLYLEAGECFHHEQSSEIYIDLLQMLEEDKIDGIEFPIHFLRNKDQIAFDSGIPLAQVRAMKKKKINFLNEDFGLLCAQKPKEVRILKSKFPLLSFGSREHKSHLQTKKLGMNPPIQIEDWIKGQNTDFTEPRGFSPLNLLRHLRLYSNRAGFRGIKKKKYHYFKEKN